MPKNLLIKLIYFLLSQQTDSAETPQQNYYEIRQVQNFVKSGQWGKTFYRFHTVIYTSLSSLWIWNCQRYTDPPTHSHDCDLSAAWGALDLSQLVLTAVSFRNVYTVWDYWSKKHAVWTCWVNSWERQQMIWFIRSDNHFPYWAWFRWARWL